MNRIVKRGLIVLAVLAGIPVILIAFLLVWFLAYTYWTADEKFNMLGAGESLATLAALNPDHNSPFVSGPCNFNDPSKDSPECMSLTRVNRGICRWWLAETCQGYEVPALFLQDPDALGVLLHATIDPCSYYEKLKKMGGGGWCLRKDDHGSQRNPVVIVFKKNSQEEALRIRIDFAEGFTTTTREEIRNEGQKKED